MKSKSPSSLLELQEQWCAHQLRHHCQEAPRVFLKPPSRGRRWWKTSKKLWQLDRALPQTNIFQRGRQKIFIISARKLRNTCSASLKMWAKSIWRSTGQLCKTSKTLRTKFSSGKSSSPRFLQESWLRWIRMITRRYFQKSDPNTNSLAHASSFL